MRTSFIDNPLLTRLSGNVFGLLTPFSTLKEPWIQTSHQGKNNSKGKGRT